MGGTPPAPPKDSPLLNCRLICLGRGALYGSLCEGRRIGRGMAAVVGITLVGEVGNTEVGDRGWSPVGDAASVNGSPGMDAREIS